jgi:hypothetical protein
MCYMNFFHHVTFHSYKHIKEMPYIYVCIYMCIYIYVYRYTQVLSCEILVFYFVFDSTWVQTRSLTLARQAFYPLNHALCPFLL